MMDSFEPGTVSLRDGRALLLRLAGPADGPLFKAYYDGLSPRSRDFMHGFAGLDPARLAESLALKTRSSDHCAIVAATTAPDRIVGYCWLDGLVTQAVPMLGIGINDDFHGAGLGRTLLRSMLALAARTRVPGVRLGVWTDNLGALHLYRSVGFADDPRMPAQTFDGRTELYLAAETGYDGPRRPRQFPMAALDGTPHDMGRQHGALFKAQILAAADAMSEQTRLPIEKAMEHASRSIPRCEEKAPELMAEIRGIAAGAGLPMEEVFTLNACLDLILSRTRTEAVAPDCWTMALTGDATAEGRTYLTWTAEDSPRWLDSCILLKLAPAGGIPCLLWTFAGFVGRPGINPHLALSAVARFRNDCGDGLPYPFICRKALACATTEEAARAIAGHDRMAGMDYAIADKHGRITILETSATTSGRAHGGTGCLAAAGRWEEERIRRIEALVHERWGANDLESIRAIVSDHGPGTLCPHDGTLASLTTLIADVRNGSLRVSYGAACGNEYATYTVTGD